MHGDLKGANILVNQHGQACLADFTLLTIVTEQGSSTGTGGTIRWMSPELLHPEAFGFTNARPTRESDCYALGMVIYEVLSGWVPFDSCKDITVILKVVSGERPAKPEGARGVWFTAEIWAMLGLCWSPRPADRPSSRDILRGLGESQSPLRSSAPHVYLDVATDVDATSSASIRSTLQNGNQLSAPPLSLSRPTTANSTLPTSRGHQVPPSYPLGATGVIIPPERGKAPAPPSDDILDGWVRKVAQGARGIFRTISRNLSRR